jgi:hypothetical protein
MKRIAEELCELSELLMLKMESIISMKEGVSLLVLYKFPHLFTYFDQTYHDRRGPLHGEDLHLKSPLQKFRNFQEIFLLFYYYYYYYYYYFVLAY